MIEKEHRAKVYRAAKAAYDFVQQNDLGCLYPGCECSAIRSHSQQRHGALDVIARNGKVVVASRDPISVMNESTKYGAMHAKFFEQDIAKASVFNGFCNKHDTELFSSIETRPLEKDNPDQVLAFYRRAVSHEYVREEDCCRYLLCNNLANRIEELEDRFSIGFYVQQQMLLDSDQEYYIDPMWQADHIKELNWVWRVFPLNLKVSMVSMMPPISESKVFRVTDPYFDIKNRRMTCPRPAVSVTIIPGVYQSHVVMVWNKLNDRYMDEWTGRLLSDDDEVVFEFLDECVFTKSEDYCISPDFWNQIPTSTKDQLAYAMIKESMGRPPIPEIPKVLSRLI